MHYNGLFAASLAFTAAWAGPVLPRGAHGTYFITPHEQYSSSVGVPGCKINTNRVAYWPEAVDCDNICVKVSYGGRSVHLLHIDHSGGAHDISFDAYNYLKFGESATKDPHADGGESMKYEYVKAGDCKDLLHDGGKLPLSASNSMNYLSECIAQPDSWVGKNYKLFNIVDSQCRYGLDEVCSLNMAVSNQPSCPHQLGLTDPLEGHKVMNIEYPTGKKVQAL